MHGQNPQPTTPTQAAQHLSGNTARHMRLYVAAFMFALLAAVAAWWQGQAAPAIHYITAPVTTGNIARAVTGTVNPVLTIIVGLYDSGVIQSLSCDYNTQVKAGQVCAKIDPRPYQSIVDQHQANLDIGKAQLNKDRASLLYLKLNYGRNRTLAARQFSTQNAADTAKYHPHR